MKLEVAHKSILTLWQVIKATWSEDRLSTEQQHAAYAEIHKALDANKGNKLLSILLNALIDYYESLEVENES